MKLSLFPHSRFPWRSFSLSFEMIPCVTLMAVGIWLIFPFETMTRNSPLMNLMVKALPEPVWGCISFVTGLYQFRVLWLGPEKARKRAALCVFVFLFFLLLLTLMESRYSILVPCLAVLAFFEGWAVRRLKKDLIILDALEMKEKALCGCNGCNG